MKAGQSQHYICAKVDTAISRFEVSSPGYEVLTQFVDALHREGLAPTTIGNHAGVVADLVAYLILMGYSWNSVTLQQLHPFMLEKLKPLCRSSRANQVGSWRRFFRFLHRKKPIPQIDPNDIPRVLLYRHENLPPHVSRKALLKVFGSIERDGKHGKRDYAFLALLAVYGMRISEVLELRVKDFDWEHDKITVSRPKSRDRVEFPLLPVIGNAVIAYLQEEFVPNPDGRLFCGRTGNKATALAVMVRKRLNAAGISSDGHSSRLFRHALARELVTCRVPLEQIAHVLGHQSFESTRVYLVTELEGLREVGLCPIIPV